MIIASAIRYRFIFHSYGRNGQITDDRPPTDNSRYCAKLFVPTTFPSKAKRWFKQYFRGKIFAQQLLHRGYEVLRKIVGKS